MVIFSFKIYLNTHTLFSQIMNLSRAKMGEEAFQAKLEKAITHVEFACELCFQQIRQGGAFLHEHPAGASSWSFDCIRKVMTTRRSAQC